jgi:glycosyltransferase involved in cell wall biosynthesis
VNVTIVGPFWFPRGAASAARVRNFAMGLRECGARVHVISMAPPPATGDARAAESAAAPGVSCEYVAPTEAAVAGWRDAERTVPRLREGLLDKVRWFAGLYAAIPAARRRLRARIDGQQCDLVLAYDRSAIRMTPLARLCRSRGVVSVLDVVEVSEYLGARPTSPLYWDAVAGTRTTPRLFDGVSVISAGLQALYRERGLGRTLVIPAIEEWPASSPPAPTGHPLFHFTYVGKMAPRDEPDLLVEAVRRLSRRGLPLVLDVVGYYEATEPGRRFVALCAEDPDLRRTVRFHGTLGEEDLRRRLAASDALVLTRRKARPEELSFPTRLVEYLRFGRPVLVSDVGDVRGYLQDGTDAVLLDPHDPERIADAMAALALRPDRGLEIGRRGREAGARAFDRKAHARRLLDFADDLRKEKAS